MTSGTLIATWPGACASAADFELLMMDLTFPADPFSISDATDAGRSSGGR